MNQPDLTRREFIKSSGAAVIGGAIATNIFSPSRSFAQNSETLKIGLVGCGGRGAGNVREAMTADKNVILTAVADVFPDELERRLQAMRNNEEIRDRIQVTKENCFTGFDAYKKVIDSDVDIVILATPPGFRSYHIKYAIEKNKHVFCEKPICTDAFGYRSFMETVAEAKKKKLGIGSGFCWRSNLAVRDAYSKIHGGEIGEVRSVYGTYNTGPARLKDVDPKWGPMEHQLRNWMHFTWLSGDHLVEQAIHNVDLTAWAMNDKMPLRCIAHGGRQLRPEKMVGHIFDHFSVVYEFEGGVKGFLFCRQQPGTHSDNTQRVYGSKGTAHVMLFNGPSYLTDLQGKRGWRSGDPKSPNMYVVEQQEFLQSIRDGKPRMDGEWLANSSMMGVMGRMAGYTGQEIAWEDAINSQERLVPEEKDWIWDKAPAIPPVAMPGQTKFI